MESYTEKSANLVDKHVDVKFLNKEIGVSGQIFANDKSTGTLVIGIFFI